MRPMEKEQKDMTADTLAELMEAREALARVRDVHEPVDALMFSGPHQRMVKVCTGCGTDDGNWQRWPCPTVRAMEAQS